MPLDLSNPKDKPTLGLCVGREETFEERIEGRLKRREGLRQNHYDGAGVRKIKIAGKNISGRRQPT